MLDRSTEVSRHHKKKFAVLGSEGRGRVSEARRAQFNNKREKALCLIGLCGLLESIRFQANHNSAHRKVVDYMSPGLLKGIGIGCFVLSAILLFVAWERYQDNANKVEAANKMMGSSGLGGGMNVLMKEITGGAKLEPGWPNATKYSLFFAIGSL